MLIITLCMDALPHRIMLTFIVRDMLLEFFRGREDFLWYPLINNVPQILIWYYQNCLINSSSLASPLTGGFSHDLSQQSGAMWEGEGGNKILHCSLAGLWEHRLEALSFLLILYTHSTFLHKTHSQEQAVPSATHG